MQRRLSPAIIGWMLEHKGELRAAHQRLAGPPDLVGWMMEHPEAVQIAHERLFGAAPPPHSAPAPPTVGLTPQQGKALLFIHECSIRRGCSPTMTEIAKELGFAARSGAHRIVKGLEERGRIRRLPNRARAIEIVEARS